MTVEEAIRRLEKVRAEVGGEAPLLMVDGLPVCDFVVGKECEWVYVTDLPSGD
jgi:hypothetical protein